MEYTPMPTMGQAIDRLRLEDAIRQQALQQARGATAAAPAIGNWLGQMGMQSPVISQSYRYPVAPPSESVSGGNPAASINTGDPMKDFLLATAQTQSQLGVSPGQRADLRALTTPPVLPPSVTQGGQPYTPTPSSQAVAAPAPQQAPQAGMQGANPMIVQLARQIKAANPGISNTDLVYAVQDAMKLQTTGMSGKAMSVPEEIFRTTLQQTGDMEAAIDAYTGAKRASKGIPRAGGEALDITELPDPQSRKQALELQNTVLNAPDVVANLERAKKFNEKAFDSGLLSAETKMAAARRTGAYNDELVNTTAYENLTLRQVLPQLKAFFGARPTNADLQIMRDIEMGLNKSKRERDVILKASIDYINERVAQAKDGLSALNVKERTPGERPKPTLEVAGDDPLGILQ